jgi:integrase
VHGVRKPKDQVNARRLSQQEYRTLGDILRKALEDGQYETTAEIIRVIALTGCRRSEVIGLRCGEVDIEGSCLRLTDSKEGASVRPIGLPVLEYLEDRSDEEQDAKDYVFPRWADDHSIRNLSQTVDEAIQRHRPSRRMSCGTVSPASEMTLASPKQLSLP